MEEISPDKRRISKEEEANLQISTPPQIDQRYTFHLNLSSLFIENTKDINNVIKLASLFEINSCKNRK